MSKQRDQSASAVRRLAVFLLSLTLATAGAGTAFGAEESGAGAAVQRIEYDDLKELLKAGNLSLKEKIDDYNENVQNYEEMRNTIKWEQWDMESKAEDLEDSDSATAAVYASNAAMLKNSARNLHKNIESMSTERSQRSLEKAADALTMSAQAVMNSYNQMALNAQAQAKSAEAAEAEYDAVQARYAIGSATLTEVEEARKQMTQAKNAGASMSQQADQLKADLLLMLGMEADAQVEIGGIPAPDLAAIAAIDLAADQNKALGNNSSVLNERHTKAAGTSARERRARRVEEAEGEETVTVQTLYQTLMEKLASYEAAGASWESAKQAYASLQNKQQAGMLTNTEYLEGEAAYLEKKAAYETASMSLKQAYENYRWEINGVTS